MRDYFIAGNWKMFKTPTEGAAFVKELSETLKGTSQKVMVAPSFASLDAVGKALHGSSVLLGAQNMAAAEEGAHTGEVSPIMLKDLGVSVVILGHSERRAIYGETDELINTKVKLALKHGFEVILCVGETLEEREAGKVEEVVNQQLLSGLEGVTEEMLAKVVIAYEPVWAIGTGKTATPQDADSVHQVIRQTIGKTYSSATAEKLIIQYGGSVKPGNAKELMAMPNIDGALVGGASLKVEDFTAIVNFNR
ncbi:triose-phosphate isomerase [Spirochaeta lutea]|uniref:Triosephosphate isomerase n=1 Tax=Spirochaeta lutea TaxID=1480694 RepID=A0A098R231_9SPIO|nr:triose-phosphate isomerase [Spirochaeta lutea]KGE73723.1 triosephosphate isomerase [Spirochaeta lutea]